LLGSCTISRPIDGGLFNHNLMLAFGIDRPRDRRDYGYNGSWALVLLWLWDSEETQGVYPSLYDSYCW
jgi:hypothetical protein